MRLNINTTTQKGDPFSSSWERLVPPILLYKIQPRSFYKLVRVSDSMRGRKLGTLLYMLCLLPVARTHCFHTKALLISGKHHHYGSFN